MVYDRCKCSDTFDISMLYYTVFETHNTPTSRSGARLPMCVGGENGIEENTSATRTRRRQRFFFCI